MNQRTEMSISDLSKYLFWDVNPGNLDLVKSKKLIIHRVLDYGSLEDWKKIMDYYGLDEITAVATGIKDLDRRSMTFVALLAGIKKEDFLCYTTRRSTAAHWSF